MDVKKNIIALTNVFDEYKINFVDMRKISIAVTMYFDGIEKKSHRWKIHSCVTKEN